MRTILLILPLLLVGCATVDPGPIAACSDALVVANTSFKRALAANYSMAKIGYANEFSGDKKSKFYNLVLTTSGGFYDFDANSGSILGTIRKERAALEQLNATTVEYLQILEMLAGGDPNTLSAAHDLNRSVNSAFRSKEALQIQANYDVFSGAFLASAGLYLENQRIDLFYDAVTNNQSNIEEYSQSCILLLHMIRDDTFRYYGSVADPIREQFDSPDKFMRAGAVTQMIELNDRVKNCLETMKILEELYSVLPKAHLEAAKAQKLNSTIEFIWGPKVNDLESVNRLESIKNRIKLSL